MYENDEIELSNFLQADERLATAGSFKLEEIAEQMLCGEEPVESEDNDIAFEEEVLSFEEDQRARNRKARNRCAASVQSVR